ncbi:hypothetical protein [Chiayiivirga flava]|uniref:DUF4124 domain-containing protein n=1 Tax=Chiayiivirga flava TaxID=659595 RepID=A0A7W8D701_9GAMM|nr:hypothetical protein [Chiayiivirga flava]MBB5207856.1 hypothetical protein [Chiayiivirga flava]
MHVRTLAAIIVLLAATAAQADVVIYRCTNDGGAVRQQDTPCRSGENQQRRTLPLPTFPVTAPPASPPPAASAPPGAPPPTNESSVRRAPAALFLCQHGESNQTYESTTGIPQRRWVPLWALDADPRAPRTALDPTTIGRTSPLRRNARDGVPALQVNALTLGTWVDDVCTPLSPAQICARRRAALDDYGRRIFNAGQSEGDALRAEERALRAQLAQECD